MLLGNHRHKCKNANDDLWKQSTTYEVLVRPLIPAKHDGVEIIKKHTILDFLGVLWITKLSAWNKPKVT